MVGQPDRKFPENDKYDNYKMTVESHDLQDMEHGWKNDKHDETGIGVMDKASVDAAKMKSSAVKAVKASVLFLGEKTPEKILEAQAKDFMAMGPDALARTLERFAATEKLYVASCDCGVDGCKCDTKEDCKCASKAEPKTACMTADAPVPPPPVADAVPPMPPPAPVLPPPTDAVPPMPPAAPVVAEAAPAAPAADDMFGEGEDEAGSPEDDAALQGLFDDKTELGPKGVQASKTESSAKQGVKTIGSQPRIASATGSDDLENIWESAPDVKHLFK
jgi:hypothetical protein